MKNLYWVVPVFIISICLPSIASDFKENGFRDANMGAAFSSFSDLQPLKDEGNWKYYISNNNNPNIGDISITETIYGFFKDHLALIHLKINKQTKEILTDTQTTGADYSSGILELLKSTYGDDCAGSFHTGYYVIKDNLWVGYTEDWKSNLDSNNDLLHTFNGELFLIDQEALNKEKPSLIPKNLSATINLATLDAKNGFRDMALGSPLLSLKGLVFVENDEDVVFYKRPTDKLQIGEAKLSGIVYGFYKGKLINILLKTKNESNSRALLLTLQENYGRGDQDNQFIEKYIWIGCRVFLSYDENLITKNAFAGFVDRSVMNQYETDKKTKAKKAKSDL